MCVCVCVVGWFTEGVEVGKCQRVLVKGKFWEVGNPREHLTSMKDRLLKKYMYKSTKMAIQNSSRFFFLLLDT